MSDPDDDIIELEYRFYRWVNGRALFEFRSKSVDPSTWYRSSGHFSIDQIMKRLLSVADNNSLKEALFDAIKEYEKETSRCIF